MNFRHYLSQPTLLVLIGSVLGVLPGFGQQVPSPQQGDLLIGFRLGINDSYLVNVGQASQFANASSGTSELPIVPLGPDLTDYNGSDPETLETLPWHQRSDVYWGAIGVRDPSAIYVSRLRPASGQSAPWPLLSFATYNTTVTNFNSVIHGGGYRTLPATSHNPVGAKQGNVEFAYSYGKQAGSQGTGNFGFFPGFETTFANGASGTALDLYEITYTSVTYLGYFTISESGQLSFTKGGTTPSPGDQDSDGDGFSDAQEEVAGTDPEDPNDFLRVQSIAWSQGQGAGLQFAGVSGRTYTVEYSETLEADSWTIIATIPVASDGLQQWLEDDAERQAKVKGFYRLSVALTDL